MMKIKFALFLVSFCIYNAVNAQDTMYIKQQGGILTKIAVNKIDSIFFYEPPLSVTDIDGNEYKVVKIDTLIWFAQNLKVTHFNNGDLIPNVEDNNQWNVTNIARSYYNNDSATYINPYGALYNWFTVTDSRNLCPMGWHVPSLEEWNSMITFLGGGEIAQNKLVEAGSAHWSWNPGANNSTGFTAVGNGYRSSFDGLSYSIRDCGLYWSSTARDTGSKWAFQFKGYDAVDQIFFSAYLGAAVRCVKNK